MCGAIYYVPKSKEEPKAILHCSDAELLSGNGDMLLKEKLD